MPRSPSSSTTRRPAAARPVARLTATVDLPTPPLPPVTAMTRTGFARGLTCRLLITRILGEGMGYISESSAQKVLVGSRASHLRHLHRARDEFKRACRPQILRYALAFAHVRDWQSRAHHDREDTA